MEHLQSYLEANKERFLNELFELLRIPSVSADVKFAADVNRTAEFVKQQLIAACADKAEICPTKGYPIVYAEKIIDAKLPTVLVYGHYDVQPADPLDLWHSPPFEPVVKDGNIYARGSCDDKGQMYMHVKAFEMMHKNNMLPCNIKFMIEGEEEVGSANLESFAKANKDFRYFHDSERCSLYYHWFAGFNLPGSGSYRFQPRFTFGCLRGSGGESNKYFVRYDFFHA
jgi:acetylornithine deacetylase/succinyl-diaminopimelate desuccinylase-like protein